MPKRFDIRKPCYILTYMAKTSMNEKLEHINKEAFWDLNHLITMNDARRALGLPPLKNDYYLGVKR